MNMKTENLPNLGLSKFLIKKITHKSSRHCYKHRTDSKLRLSFPNPCIYEVILKDRNGGQVFGLHAKNEV